jgi:hypothetical protein
MYVVQLFEDDQWVDLQTYPSRDQAEASARLARTVEARVVERPERVAPETIRRYLGSDLLPSIVEAVEALQRLGYELAELEAGENMPIKALVVLDPDEDNAQFTTLYWQTTAWVE